MTRSFDEELVAQAPQPWLSAALSAAAAPPIPQRGKLAVVTLPGEIDITNEDQVLDELACALRSETAVLVADATATTFCGCAGVSVLIRTHQHTAAVGAQLRVAASPAMRRILDLTGVHHLLDTYPTLTAALADGRSTR